MITNIITHARRNAVAYAALMLATTGTSYAAASLSQDSVKAKHIATGAVASSEVKDGTLLAKDFKAGQIRAAIDGKNGDNGLKGEKGEKGERGPQGPAGPSAAFTRHVPGSAVIPPGNTDVVTLDLPAGAYVVTARVDGAHAAGSTTTTRLECAIVGPGGESVDYSKQRLAPNDVADRADLRGAHAQRGDHARTRPGTVKTVCSNTLAGGSGDRADQPPA